MHVHGERKQSIMRRAKEKSIVRYCVTFTVCLQTPDQTLTVNRSSRWFSFSRKFIIGAFVFMWKKKEKFSPASCEAHGCSRQLNKIYT